MKSRSPYGDMGLRRLGCHVPTLLHDVLVIPRTCFEHSPRSVLSDVDFKIADKTISELIVKFPS